MIIGEVKTFAGNKPPHNCLWCDGTSLAKETHPVLYSILQDTYGGDTTHFNLPDLTPYGTNYIICIAGEVPTMKGTTQATIELIKANGSGVPNLVEVIQQQLLNELPENQTVHLMAKGNGGIGLYGNSTAVAINRDTVNITALNTNIQNGNGSYSITSTDTNGEIQFNTPNSSIRLTNDQLNIVADAYATIDTENLYITAEVEIDGTTSIVGDVNLYTARKINLGSAYSYLSATGSTEVTLSANKTLLLEADQRKLGVLHADSDSGDTVTLANDVLKVKKAGNDANNPNSFTEGVNIGNMNQLRKHLILQIESTDKAVQFPRLDTWQRDAVFASATEQEKRDADGCVIFNITYKRFEYFAWKGSNWDWWYSNDQPVPDTPPIESDYKPHPYDDNLFNDG